MYSAPGCCRIMLLTVHASEIYYFLMYIANMRHISWNISYKCPWQIIFCLNVFEANVYVYNYGYGKLCRSWIRLQQSFLLMNVDMCMSVITENAASSIWLWKIIIFVWIWLRQPFYSSIRLHKIFPLWVRPWQLIYERMYLNQMIVLVKAAVSYSFMYRCSYSKLIFLSWIWTRQMNITTVKLWTWPSQLNLYRRVITAILLFFDAAVINNFA